MQASRWATKSDNAQPPQPSQPAPAAQVAPEPPRENVAHQTPEPAYDYDYPDASLDSFAQTAATDDLFYDDDFTPVSEPVVEQTTVDVAPQEPTPEPAPAVEPASMPAAGIGRSRHSEPQHIPQGPANGERGRGGGRGRARGGRGRGRGGNTNANAPSESRDSKNKDIRLEDKAEQEPKADAAPTTTTETDPPPTPADPAAPKPAQSVRGDRTLTGGPKRSRLTEEQLNAKLASMRSKNDALIEAHARAEADSAEAEAREAAAAKQNAERKKLQAERQKVDRQNRQQMMGERERNRLRKLDAMGGREWDLEKEEGFNGTGEERRRGATRGAHGGLAPGRTPAPAPAPAPAKAEDVGAARAEDPVPQSSHRERGRGRGRGARGGRGGGRGDHNGNSHNPPAKRPDQQPPTAADFPTLPAKSDPKPADAEPPKKLDFPISIKGKAAEIKTQDLEQRPGVKKQDSFGLPSPAVGSWADQVEGS